MKTDMPFPRAQSGKVSRLTDVSAVMLPIRSPGTVTPALRDWVIKHAGMGMIYVPRMLRPILTQHVRK